MPAICVASLWYAMLDELVVVKFYVPLSTYRLLFIMKILHVVHGKNKKYDKKEKRKKRAHYNLVQSHNIAQNTADSIAR